jgi:2-isopropylmalate synthase
MDAHRRYRPFRRIELPDRTWPDRTIRQAPRWLSTDLRDGNQALAEPMSPQRKLILFNLLTGLGYKEIEVGFPAASQDDYDFLRLLVEQDRIPDDVRITVGVPARDTLIRRTVESLVGARRATICVFNATAPEWRRLILGADRDECRDLAVQGTRWTLKFAEMLLGDCDLGFEYTLEMFNETEPEFALEVCAAVMDVWQPGPGRETVFNLPSTVERSGPHVFADQVEWMDRHLPAREHICLSVHPHNDRGTAVAAAELAVAAGADRVEGCLFGNGERTGNVCLVTLALNLLGQGVDPRIDFSDVDRVRRTVEYCTGIPVHPRHPYGGDLVFTAFSGTHQDVINKAFAALERTAAAVGTDPAEVAWAVPYLLIDPKDIGRTYEAIIRVNSQSGKGGVAYVMRTCHAINLPYGLRADFAKVVQAHTEATGGEVSPEEMWQLFAAEYLTNAWPPDDEMPFAAASLQVECRSGDSAGNLRAELDPVISAAFPSLEFDTRVVGGGRGAASRGAAGRGDAEAAFAVYAECRIAGEPAPVWGVGLDSDAAFAALAAVRSAAARAPGVRAAGEVEARVLWTRCGGRGRGAPGAASRKMSCPPAKCDDAADEPSPTGPLHPTDSRRRRRSAAHREGPAGAFREAHRGRGRQLDDGDVHALRRDERADTRNRARRVRPPAANPHGRGGVRRPGGRPGAGGPGIPPQRGRELTFIRDHVRRLVVGRVLADGG